MANKVRIGIIGLGAQGSMYAKFIADGMVPNMEIGAICDHHSGKGEVVDSTYPGVTFYTDYIAMLESGDVDAVVTCVPHTSTRRWESHFAADIHALVEKPAGSMRDSQELGAFAETKPT
jgi:predicted dehydrogenase